MSAEPISDEPMAWPVSEYYVDSADVTTYTVETPHGKLYVKGRALAEDIAAIPMWKRLAEQQTARGRLVPITRADPDGERSDYAVLVSMAQLLEEILAAQRHLLARLGQSTDSRSSVEVRTSTRGVDITAKSYADSDVSSQVTPAVLAYFDTLEQVQARLNGGAS